MMCLSVFNMGRVNGTGFHFNALAGGSVEVGEVVMGGFRCKKIKEAVNSRLNLD